jgi:predicted secreted hydrolase
VSAGSLVAPDGTARRLGLADVQIDVLDHWPSPRDGARYPARWRLRVPSAGLDLEVTPRIADQELALTVRYWEGAVAVTGTAAGAPVEGAGYVELTGYAGGSPPGSVRQ